jgi:hypothetical protein
MNLGEHYIVTDKHQGTIFSLGQVVNIRHIDDINHEVWVTSANDHWQGWIRSEHLVPAHQIYENGELKWVGPHYIMPCERGNSIEEKSYERPSDFKIDDGVVIFGKNSTIKLFDQYKVGTAISEIDKDDFSNKEEWEEILKSFRIELGDQVEITCFGNSRVRGEVVGLVDKRFEVEFRGCKGLFYLNELVKI